MLLHAFEACSWSLSELLFSCLGHLGSFWFLDPLASEQVLGSIEELNANEGEEGH